MTPARLFHIRSSYFYGGPERQITYLTEALVTKGVQSAVATFAPAADPGRNRYYTKLQELGIPCHRVDIAGSFDRSPIGKIENIVTDGVYNVLISHDYRADYVALKVASTLSLPAVSFSRGWTRNSIRVKFYEWLDRRFLRRMNGVVAVSQTKYDELARIGIDETKLVYIPNSIPTEKITPRTNRIREKFGIPHDAFLVGTAGRLSVEKNQDVLIRAAIAVLDRTGNNKLRFIVAGEGTRREKLAAMIPDTYKNHIILAGWIDDNDALYADLDLFVLTSLTEGFPNVLLEAGKYGLPAISTPAGGAVDIIEDNRTGLFFHFGAADDLAEKIIRLVNDDAVRRRLGDGLGNITRKEYDAAVNSLRLLKFINCVRERYEPA